jgi:hypothetical protein
MSKRLPGPVKQAGKVKAFHAQAMVADPRVRGVEEKLHSFLTSALDGAQCYISRPGRFTSGKERL